MPFDQGPNAVNFLLLIFLTVSIVCSIYFFLKLKSSTNKDQSSEIQNLKKDILTLSTENLEKDKKIIELSNNNLDETQAIAKASSKAKEILDIANKRAQDIELESEKLAVKQKQSLKSEKDSLFEEQKRLDDRERSILDRSKNLDDRFKRLEDKEKQLSGFEDTIKAKLSSVEEKLVEISGISREEAEKRVMSITEQKMKHWTAEQIREAKKNVEFGSEEVAQHILIDAMIRGATDSYGDVATTKFKLTSDDQKGKIIGKEGRNIKTIEKYTGVEVMVDDDNLSITLSCFDPIRREVAAITIARLLKDGRMHPGTIEETIDKVKSDLLRMIKKEGQELATKAGFPDLPEEIVKLLGKFRYRFSYGQNLARHTMEMVQIGEYLASELNLDIKAVKLACLLHDLGKVVITDSLGQDSRQHHWISGEIARKYSLPWKVINGIEAHHEDIPSECMEAEIVKIADKISGSRPGARRESYDEYIKRIVELEKLAKEFEGVKDAYAIFAGRELRILIDPLKIDDDSAEVLSFNVATKVADLPNHYPGGVKVNVIRERRFTKEA